MMRLFRRRNTSGALPSSQASEDDVTSPKSPVVSRKTTTNLGGSRLKKQESSELSGAVPPPSPSMISSAAMALAERYASPPPTPTPVRQEQMIEVRGARRDGPVKVSDTLNLFVSTWNMVGCTVLPTKAVLKYWLPLDYDLYAIALQNSRSVKQVQEKIIDYLGEDYNSFKYILLGQTSLLMFARTDFVSSGVLAPTRLNDLVKFEIKSKGLVSSSTGRGCILMQMTFHNTTMAFVALNLDDDPEGLEKRKTDLDFCMKASGIVASETNEIGTPVLTSVQHVFLFGNFGIKTTEKCQGSSKNNWKGKWAPLLYSPEFEEMSKANPSMDNFEELDVDYPPTSRRKIGGSSKVGELPPASPRAGNMPPPSPRSTNLPPPSPRTGGGTLRASFESLEIGDLNSPTGATTRRLSDGYLSMFEKSFDLEQLFDPKLVKKEGEPSYEDRIFCRTHENYKHLRELGVSGSCEMVRSGTHVPVYSTFRMCGLDNALMKRWQVITGNLPVENATRIDTRMVTGVVEDLVSFLNEKANLEKAQEAERERVRQEYLSQMRLCDRCAEPLSLEGGDVELGDKACFHRKCFTCEDCGKDLLGEKLMFADDKWLCLDSFNRIYQSGCPVCKLSVEGEHIRVGKERTAYHLPCFGCTVCGKKLFENGKLIEFLDMDGKPYCVEHFETVKSKCCSACKKSIADEDRLRPNSTFHKKCYCCAVCGLDMDTTDLRVVIRDYKVFCETDHLKDVQAREKKRQFKLKKEEEAKQEKEEQEEAERKEKEMLARRISMIPKGFDITNYDIPEDDDIEEEDEDD